ncbi:hypothetical protein [Actinomadura opuntiae]|uniref:hypothetical protein n=1 Tax=Actinomadura sp. OS1-43 TaxID=604315 RepID=UPI00255AE89D|nr:hypothetical protein [Actinomadura sp. OS1-43]MDL4814014.1 hypothetical protein [Actinomadura sp. OS1-43]
MIFDGIRFKLIVSSSIQRRSLGGIMGQIGYSSGFAQQTSFGPTHNWELFLPALDGGFVGFYRDPDGWHGPYACTPPGSPKILTLAWIEGDYHLQDNGDQADFELIAVQEDGKLQHWWRENAGALAWHQGPQLPMDKPAVGVTLGRGHHHDKTFPDGQPYHETMYVYAPRAGDGIELIKTSMYGEGPPDWTTIGTSDMVGGAYGHTSGVGWALGTVWSGNVNWDDSSERGYPILAGVSGDGKIWTAERYVDTNGYEHLEDQSVAPTGARGRPAIVQSDRAYDSGWLGRGSTGNRHQGNYELLAPSVTGGFVHYWRPNGDGEEPIDHWRPAGTVGVLLYDELSVFQAQDQERRSGDDTAPLELFAWVRGETWVHHFIQWNLPNGVFVWEGPFKVGPKPIAAGLQPGTPVGMVRPNELTALVAGADGSVQAINTTASGWTALDEILPAGTAKPGTPIAVSGWEYMAPGGIVYREAVAALAGHDGSVLALRMATTGEWGEFQQVAPPGTVLPGSAVALSQVPTPGFGAEQIIAYATAEGALQSILLTGRFGGWSAPVLIAPKGTVAADGAIKLVKRYQNPPPPNSGDGLPPPPDGSADRLDLVYVGANGAVYDMVLSKQAMNAWELPALVAPPGSVPAGGDLCLVLQANPQRPQPDRLLVAFASADGAVQVYSNEVGDATFTGPAPATPPGTVPAGAVLAGFTRPFTRDATVLWIAADGAIQTVTRSGEEPWTTPVALTPPGSAVPAGHFDVCKAMGQNFNGDVMFVAPDWSLKHCQIPSPITVQQPAVAASPFPATPDHTAAVVKHTATLLENRVSGEAAIRAFESDGVARQLVAANPTYQQNRGEWLLYPIQAAMTAGGRQADAIVACQQAFTVFTDLAQQNPANDSYRYNQVRALVSLTDCYRDNGDLALAADSADQAITAARALAAATPAYQQAAAEWLVWPLQAALAAARRLPEAISACQEAIDVAAGLLKSDPTNSVYAYDHAAPLVSLVERYLDHGDTQLAVDTAVQAADAARAMATADPARRQSFGEWLLWPIQSAYSTAGRLPGAISACQEAANLFEQLTAQDAANLSYRLDRANALVTLTARYSDHHDHAQAADTAAQALEAGHALTTADTAYQPFLGDWLITTIAPALDGGGHHDQAVTGATEAVQIFQLLDEGQPGQYGANLAAAQALLAKLNAEPAN